MIELNDLIAETVTSIVREIRQRQENADEQRNEHGKFHLKDDQSNQEPLFQIDGQVISEVKAEGSGSTKGNFRLYVVFFGDGDCAKVVSKSANLHRPLCPVPINISRYTVIRKASS